MPRPSHIHLNALLALTLALSLLLLPLLLSPLPFAQATTTTYSCTSSDTAYLTPPSPPPSLSDGRSVSLPQQCDNNGWQWYDGRCWLYSQYYQFSTYYPSGSSQLAYNDAVNFCQAQSATLLPIFTPREHCFASYGIVGSSASSRGCINAPGQAGTYCYLGVTANAGTGYNYYMQPSQDSLVASTTFQYDPVPVWGGGASPWYNKGSCTYNFTTCVLTSSSCEPKSTAIGSGGQNCGGIDVNNNGANWVSGSCTNTYAYICVKVARCPKGYERYAPFAGVPVRVNPSLQTGCPLSGSYSMGSCVQCLAGKYHPQDSASNADALCFNCPAGTFGDVGATSSACSGVCPAGFYCPLGTARATMPACSAGFYNPNTGATNSSACGPTDAGYWSPTNSSSQLPCDAGRCGYPGASSSQCQSPCPAGYQCAQGTGCFNQTAIPKLYPSPCNAANKYAPAG